MIPGQYPGKEEKKMTINERIKQAIENFDSETDNLDKIIALAYFIGREEATNEISDKVNAIFADPKSIITCFAIDETEI